MRSLRYTFLSTLFVLTAILSSIGADIVPEEAEDGLMFANPSNSPSPSSSPSKSFSPTSSKRPSSSPSRSAAPSFSSKAPSSSPSSAPSASPIGATPKPTRRYTTNPTSTPTVTAMPTAAKRKKGFGHYFLVTIKWIFILVVCGVLAVLGWEHWDRIYYFLMQCMRQLRICCEAFMNQIKLCCGTCLTKSKELVMRLIVRMNSARGSGGGGGDDGSMLDGLLMGGR